MRRRLLVLLALAFLIVPFATNIASAESHHQDANASKSQPTIDNTSDVGTAQANEANAKDTSQTNGNNANNGKPDNNTGSEGKPCNADHGRPDFGLSHNKKCQEASGTEGPPGDATCSDGIDNDNDGLVDSNDPDCQSQEGSGTEGPPGDATCSDGIDNDNDGLVDSNDPDCQGGQEAVNQCTAEAGDPGLLTDDTLGQTLWDGGLQIPPLTEDPEGNGAISGPLKEAGTGTPIEVVTDEASCAVDLLIDENTGFDL